MDSQEHLKAITDIRTMMERSSRFISLSGLSGVCAGIFALCGAAVAYIKLNSFNGTYERFELKNTIIYLLLVASVVLTLSVATGIALTVRNSKKKGVKIWDATIKRLLINLMIPLMAGGFFCLSMLYHGFVGFVAPATLIFYGLTLINASKYTLNDIRYLGICEIILGLMASVYIHNGLLFWAVGFGVLHIIYGTVMYFKYERN